MSQGYILLQSLDIIVAIISGTIAVVATAFAGYQTIATRRHHRLSVRPHLGFSFYEFEGEANNCDVWMINDGLGPAIIDHLEIWHFGILITDSSEPATYITEIRAWVGSLEQIVSYRYYCPYAGESFRPSREHLVLRLTPKSEMENTEQELSQFFRGISYKIIYRTLYDEKFVLEHSFGKRNLTQLT